VHIIEQICCYNKCGIGMQGLNPHLRFGEHLLGKFLPFLKGDKRVFYIVYYFIINKSVQKNGLVFNSELEGVC